MDGSYHKGAGLYNPRLIEPLSIKKIAALLFLRQFSFRSMLFRNSWVIRDRWVPLAYTYPNSKVKSQSAMGMETS